MSAVLVDAVGLSASRPGRPLLDDVSLTVHEGDRIGIIGLNGTGKSTLMRILAGRDEPEAGLVRRGRSVRAVLLDQTDDLPEGTVAEIVGDGWEAEAALDRLGMSAEAQRTAADLSGGQRKRVALARALAQESDLLLLDEPTNHLDLEGISYLEERLRRHRGGLVLVTHDRWLLDRLTTRIVELQRGTAYVHSGGYESYLAAKSDREDIAAKAEASRRVLARQELAWLRRGAKARTRKSRSRLASAARIIEGGPPPEERSGELDFGDVGTPRLGDRVVELTSVSAGWPQRPPAVEHVDLQLQPADRLGIIGPNGAGKSTLLGIITGRIAPLSGEVVTGSTVEVAELDQLGEQLDPDARVRDVVTGGSRVPDHRDKALLERFWFDDDGQWAQVSTLSGGERRRLQLLVTLARRPNLLVLDEPTNDLDIDTLRALEGFLDDFSGAAVVVSHDRVLLERTCHRFLVVDDGTAQLLAGGLDDYIQARLNQSPQPAKTAPRRTDPRTESDSPPKPKRRSPTHLRRLIAETEVRIEGLSARRDELSVVVADPSLGHADRQSAALELGSVDDALAAAEEEWLVLSEEAER